MKRLLILLNLNERTLLAAGYLLLGVCLGMAWQTARAHQHWSGFAWVVAWVSLILVGGWVFNHLNEMLRYMQALEAERSEVLRERCR